MEKCYFLLFERLLNDKQLCRHPECLLTMRKVSFSQLVFGILERITTFKPKPEGYVGPKLEAFEKNWLEPNKELLR